MRHLLFICFSLFFLGTANAAEPVPIIFDTDMANDCDDAGALAVLNALADEGKAKILAIVTNRKDPSNASAAAADAINTYYGRPNLLIGTDKDGAKTRRPRPSSYCPALRDEFPNDVGPDDQCPDSLSVYRKTLAAQPDKSVVICSVGALSNLEDLINSTADEHSPLDGKELIKKKVKLTLIMGGGFPRTAVPETNIKLDPASAVTVCNQWPGPILWQGYEVGAAIISGAGLKNTSSKNPVRRSFELRPYREGVAIDKGKPSHDQATVMLAVFGAEPEYWTVISKGRVVFDSDGHSQFRKDWAKNHRYVKIKGDPAKMAKRIETLMAQPPKSKSTQN